MEDTFFLPLPQFNHHQHLPDQFLWTMSKKKPHSRDPPEERIFSHRPPSVLELEAAQQEQPHHTLQVGLGQTETTLVTSQPWGQPGTPPEPGGTRGSSSASPHTSAGVAKSVKCIIKCCSAGLRVHRQSGFRFKRDYLGFLCREGTVLALELLLHQQGFP